MKYVSIDQVVQGDHLAKPIYSSDGRILLEENVYLTIGLISKLRELGITTIYIKDELLEQLDLEIEEEEVITDETKREAVATLASGFQYIQAGESEFRLKAVSNVAGSIIDDVLRNQEVLVSLTDIRTEDNELFLHSIQVCVLSVLIGIKLHLDRSKLRDLAIGALLHDIGKIVEDDDDKKGEYDNDHTWKGFNFMRRNPEMSNLSSVVMLQHHEHVDGTGYPRGIKADDIHLNAKITAVANMYDNYITKEDDESGRVLYPYEACEKIMALTNLHFDHDVVWSFLRSVAFYPNGSHVKLTTGETGIVVGQNKGLPQRPVVRLMKTSYQIDQVVVKEIDLAKETTVFIDKIIS